MEARIIEYPRSNGLDYHHNSPLIGEIPTNDYTHFHRSIDQLRSLNERGILNTNHFQNVLIPSSTSPIVLQASGVYSEIKLNDDHKMLDDYHPSNKSVHRNGDEAMDKSEADEYKKDNASGAAGNNDFRIIQSPQQYSLTNSSMSPIDSNGQIIHSQQTTFSSMEAPSEAESHIKSKVRGNLIFFCCQMILNRHPAFI